MLVGHLGIGFLAKRTEPRLSLGTLVFAAMLADILWTIFMMLGLERVTFGTGLGAGNYFEAVDVALSHSLLMGVLWGVLFAFAYTRMRPWGRTAWLLAAVVISHWGLDVVSHRPDMPLAPATSTRLGLGLWTSLPATLAVEGGLWAISIVLYVRATAARKRAGTYMFWIVALLLTLVWYNNIAGPPPANPRSASLASFTLFTLIVLWGYWIDRLRSCRSIQIPRQEPVL